MPGGPAPLGFAYFAAVKFAGYTGAAWVLRRSYQAKETSVWKVGAARTALGLAAGAAYGGLFLWLAKHSATPGSYNVGEPPYLYFGGLVPIRLGEWSLIIWYFFQRGRTNPGLLLRNSALGILWSFILDAVGIFTAIVAPGGVWIC
jgi:hypothetical protein